jgi:pyridoxal phosphate enzyme (YggS family)
VILVRDASFGCTKFLSDQFNPAVSGNNNSVLRCVAFYLYNSTVNEVAHNVERICERIRAAALRANREPEAVTLVAISKGVEPRQIEAATSAGQTLFGESKIQEARAKIPLVSQRARWHLVGHLQTNKAREAIALFELIHSVDSIKLALELNKWAERAGKVQGILLEVNTSGEASKFGFKLEDVSRALNEINRMPRIEVHGLMTIAPFVEDPEKARPFFRRLRERRDEAGLRELSMGMTHDFVIAIEEGATMVRIGTAIFGERLVRRSLGEGGTRHEPAE